MAIQLCSQRRRRIAIQISDYQPANTLFPESPAQTGADTAGAAGDDDNLVTKLHTQAA